MSAPTDTRDFVAKLREYLTTEQTRQHLMREHAQRQQQILDPKSASWVRESLSRQESDAKIRETHMGELLRALPQDGTR